MCYNRLTENPKCNEESEMTARYVTSTHEIKDAYKKVQIDAKEARVKIEVSSGGTSVVFFERKRRPYECFVREDTLTIVPKKARWYHFLRIDIDRSEIKLSLPESLLEALSVKVNVGSVDLSSVACSGRIEIKANTGKVTACGVSCSSFDSQGNTGSITLQELAAEDSICVKRNTGRVTVNDCHAKRYRIQTNTGKVCGKLPANTVFAVKTNTGRVELPEIAIGDAVGAICEVKTNTGSVRFE